MIEVVKQGVLYPERTFELFCRACASQLRFKGADVEHSATVNSIQCPVCETGNDVDTLAKDITERESHYRPLGQQTI